MAAGACKLAWIIFAALSFRANYVPQVDFYGKNEDIIISNPGCKKGYYKRQMARGSAGPFGQCF